MGSMPGKLPPITECGADSATEYRINVEIHRKKKIKKEVPYRLEDRPFRIDGKECFEIFYHTML